jgi:hypothetical protein
MYFFWEISFHVYMPYADFMGPQLAFVKKKSYKGPPWIGGGGGRKKKIKSIFHLYLVFFHSLLLIRRPTASV